jgi:trimeric autotransporter adhesin
MKAPQQCLHTHLFLSFTILLSISQSLNGQNPQEYFLDNLEHNQTIIYCPGEDSIKLYALTGTTEPSWIINDGQDTIYCEILTLENGYEGLVSFQSFPDVVFNLQLYPLTLNFTKEHTIVCGETLSLDPVTSNYNGTEPLSYLWSPSTGLNDPTVPDPDISATENTEYTLEVTTANGCIISDQLNVNVTPLSVNAGEDISVTCATEVLMENVSTNYSGNAPLSFEWGPSEALDDPYSNSPTLFANRNEEITVTVSTFNGCEASDAFSISVVPLEAPEICIVGRDPANKNIVIWNKPASPSIDSFFIYKETFITDEFQKVGAVEYHALSIFVDSLSNPDVQSNRYKLSALDNCGVETELSPHHKTLHLAINQGQNDTWNLIWENYEGFPASTYLIYRGTHKDSMEMIGASPASNTQFSDLNAPTGITLYYQIEVFGPNVCNPGSVPDSRKSSAYSSSRSNIVEFELVSTNKLSSVTNPFDIYPNPAKNQIRIISANNDIIGTIGIFNIGGQLLKEVTVPGNDTSINLENLAAGIYFIRISNNKKVYTQKFTKQ